MYGARCTARVRSLNSPHRGERCGNPPIPFGTVCGKHGGYLPGVRAAAEREYLAFLRGDRGYAPPWARAAAVRSWENAQRRWTRRQEKKWGSEPSARPSEPRQDKAPDPFAYEGWN